MHICIPDTREVRPQHGSAYLLYNIHIDGLYHCSLRYKQLLHLHQLLTKRFNLHYSYQLPQFPPKKLLPLSSAQVEERRQQLEKYLQYISQDKLISSSSIFNLYLLEAQRESTHIKEKHVHLDIELVNGQKIRIPILTHDSSDDVLQACCRALGLSDRYHAYFCLCLCGYDVVRDKLIIKRRLSFNEAPFITLQRHHIDGHAYQNENHRQQNNNNGNRSFVTHRILLRKSYWDPIYDTYILNDQQALNLLFIQTVYDMKHSLMFVDRETYHRLESLLAQDMKLEYILLARTLKYYNYVHFEPCYSDYPRPRTKVMISIGSKELNMRVLKNPVAGPKATLRSAKSINSSMISNNNSLSETNSNTTAASMQQKASSNDKNRDEPVLYCTSSIVPSGYQRLLTKDEIVEEEYNFKVPLIRCWRLTSLEALNSNCPPSGSVSKVDSMTNNANSNRGYNQSGTSSTPVATTTLAGGKRRSLNLFNSIVGNSPPNRANSSTNANYTNGGQMPGRQVVSSGQNGTSLMAALSAANNNNNNNNNTTNGSTSSPCPSAYNCNQNNLQSSSSLRDLINRNQQNGDSSNSTIASECYHHQFCQHENQFYESDRMASAGTGSTGSLEQPMSQYELSFEYLISKDTLKWITISSDQAIFISISLQGVVDELVSKREGPCYVPQQQQQHQQQLQQLHQGQNAHQSSSQWPLYFNPSPPRSDQSTTQLIPPLYPTAYDGITNIVSNNHNNHSRRQAPHKEHAAAKPVTETFSYMQRDGTQRQAVGLVRPFLRDAAARSLSLDHQQAASVRLQSRAMSSITSFWPQMQNQHQQQQQPSTGFMGSCSSGSTTTSSGSVMGRFSSSNNGDGTRINAENGSLTQHRELEIARMSKKKTPSPIINGAFEGPTSNGHLM